MGYCLKGLEEGAGKGAKAEEAHYLYRLVSLELGLGPSPCAFPDFFSALQGCQGHWRSSLPFLFPVACWLPAVRAGKAAELTIHGGPVQYACAGVQSGCPGWTECQVGWEAGGSTGREILMGI